GVNMDGWLAQPCDGRPHHRHKAGSGAVRTDPADDDWALCRGLPVRKTGTSRTVGQGGLPIGFCCPRKPLRLNTEGGSYRVEHHSDGRHRRCRLSSSALPCGFHLASSPYLAIAAKGRRVANHSLWAPESTLRTAPTTGWSGG